ATTESATRHFLLVLGNAGSPAALPAVSRRLEAQSAEVRASAVSALRFIATDEAEERLIALLATDAVPDVRAEALRSIGYRSSTDRARRAIRQALTADQSTAVRRAALNYLWARRHDWPDIETLVECVARND